MGLESVQRRHANDIVVDKMEHVSSDTSLDVYDLLTKVTATSASVTITLPNVVRARGKRYVVYVSNVSGTYTVTVQDKADETGMNDIVMNSPGEGVILESDGERWWLVGQLGGEVVQDSVLYDDFNGSPLIVQDDGTAASGVDTEVNVMKVGNSNLLWYLTNIGTQTIIAPVHSANGLNVSRDQTADDGSILDLGINSDSPAAYTVGTDACYARMQFSIADVSGTDDCAFGFKIASARQAAIDDETDMAVLNVISGNITIETILNDAATSSTDTTDDWADGETHTLEVQVDGDGAATFLIDGAAPSTTATFTFDSGDTIVPFMYILQDTDLAGEINLKEFECGLLPQ